MSRRTPAGCCEAVIIVRSVAPNACRARAATCADRRSRSAVVAALVRSAAAVRARVLLLLLGALLLGALLLGANTSSSQTQLCAVSLRQAARAPWPSQARCLSCVISRNLRACTRAWEQQGSCGAALQRRACAARVTRGA
jgi:hypothetical protein